MKTLQQLSSELEADPQNTSFTKMMDGVELPCTPDDRTAILDDRAQMLFNSQSVSAVSFRALAFTLQSMGLYEQVKAAALATIEGEIWWNTAQASTVPREHPFVAALGKSLGQTPEHLDAIFASAIKLPQD